MQDIKIEQFLDSTGKVTLLPSKQAKRLAVLEYLTQKFETEHIYTEREVNEIVNQWITFGDYFLIRRELVDYKFLARERDGSRYWRIWVKPQTDEE